MFNGCCGRQAPERPLRPQFQVFHFNSDNCNIQQRPLSSTVACRMAQGPPTFEAGPSNSSRQAQSSHSVPSTHTSTFQVQLPSEQPQNAPVQYQNTLHSQDYASLASQAQHVASATVPNYAGYYSYPQTWNNQWQAYNYNPAPSASYQYGYPQAQPPKVAAPIVPQKRKVPSPQPSPSPPPPPPFHNEWDRVMKQFLASAGLTQALRGFETDMVVMSTEWEKTAVPKALKILSEDLSVGLCYLSNNPFSLLLSHRGIEIRRSKRR